MPRGFIESTAYLKTAQTPELVTQLISLFEQRGFKRVTQLIPGQAVVSVAVLPGQAGWSLIKTQPADLLCQPDAASQLLLVALCTALRTPGCLIRVHDAAPWGEVMLESDGLGQQHLTGWWFDEAHPEGHHFYGQPLSETDAQHRFDYLPELQVVLDNCRYGEHVPIDIFCAALAEQFAAQHSGFVSAWEYDPWAAMNEHLPSSDWSLLNFERVQPESELEAEFQSGSETQSSSALMVIEAEPFLYASGASVQVGDAVLTDNGQTPARVVGMMQMRAESGGLRPVGVRVRDRQGEYIVWAHALSAQLRLVARLGALEEDRA